MSPNQNPSGIERSSTVRDLLEDVLPLMGISGDVDVFEDGDTITANISGKDLKALTGTNGKALNALQCIANVAANRNNDTWTRVVVDAAGYRAERRDSLEACATETADKAVAEDTEVILEPMNAFERRIIHCALADREDVITDSRGDEPYRCVVVAPTPSES